jgi:hypothetical protein
MFGRGGRLNSVEKQVFTRNSVARMAKRNFSGVNI